MSYNTNPIQGAELPLHWSEYQWPKWIPEAVRHQLRQFWSEEFHRSPREWQKSFQYAYASHRNLGERVRIKLSRHRGGNNRIRAGRWVPMWNNIARLICRDGTVIVASTCDLLPLPPAP